MATSEPPGEFPIGLSGDLSPTPDQRAREAHYRRYISHINERKLDLAEFVADEMVHNNRHMTRKEFESMLAEDVAAFPDLYFDLHMVLVTGDRVASRILFKATQVKEWRGKKPDGKTVAFEELVFYRFEGDKIKEVWSIVGEPKPIDS
ncbi:SnoaL-domain-containing protein [Peniophora sp. CONT]|nr:SnoaL-domain-containing protein [Peniophora sp. CONT]